MQLQQWHLPVSNPSVPHHPTSSVLCDSSVSLSKGDKTLTEEMDSCVQGVEKAREVLLWSG